MRYKLAVIGGVLVTMAALTVPRARRAILLSSSHSQASIATQDSDDSRLISLIRELRSENYNQRTAAKSALIQLSAESARKREVVIKKLLRITEAADRTVNFIKDP